MPQLPNLLQQMGQPLLVFPIKSAELVTVDVQHPHHLSFMHNGDHNLRVTCRRTCNMPLTFVHILNNNGLICGPRLPTHPVTLVELRAGWRSLELGQSEILVGFFPSDPVVAYPPPIELLL